MLGGDASELEAMWEPEGTQWLGWELTLESQWAGEAEMCGGGYSGINFAQPTEEW